MSPDKKSKIGSVLVGASLSAIFGVAAVATAIGDNILTSVAGGVSAVGGLTVAITAGSGMLGNNVEKLGFKKAIYGALAALPLIFGVAAYGLGAKAAADEPRPENETAIQQTLDNKEQHKAQDSTDLRAEP